MNHYRQPGFAYAANKTLVRLRIAKLINFWTQRGKPNVCFIWIPKTAGSSVQRWLNDSLGMKKIVDVKWVNGAFANKGAITFGHIDYPALVRRGIVSRNFDSTAFKFSFVRNPFDRAVSLYYYLGRVGTINPDMSFESFLERLEKGVEPIGLYNVRGLSQCNPQISWLLDQNGNWIVDYLADIERFNDHIANIARHLNVEPTLYHENRTPREAALDSFYRREENIELVRKIFWRDFKLLQYEPDPHVGLRETSSPVKD